MNKNNNNTIKKNDFASFNLVYMPKKYAYKIKMGDISDSNIKNLLKKYFYIR
jgi:hypothetical protein